ncbi:type 1 periplasmic binding fold superfamily protein [Flavobacterium sp.]|jgi:hypothetical protein|uniref:type 1 periplasmic binding fold superfamily protein n=1 Tax=Flavobacterium sp. TaxID=239 RepID=UPI0037C0A751
MKTIINKFTKATNVSASKSILLATLFSISFIACDKDDNPIAPPVNEEELITTVKVTLTNGTNVVTLTSKDLDGPNQPVLTVVGTLIANTTYDGVVELLDETKNPVDIVSEEIEESEEEKREHQFFYNLTGLTGSTVYSDFDSNGNPIGLNFSYTTGAASTGSFTITLRHLPIKTAAGVASGDITNAGGSTDAQATFNDLVIQ